MGKRHYTGQNMVGDIERISAEVKRAEGRLILANKKHNALLAHRDRLAIYAPFDGLLMKLPKVDNGHVKKGDILAVLEDANHRRVTAFLKQDEVLHVKLGEKVDVYVPAVDKWLAGRVTSIDRTDGFIKQHNRRADSLINWRESSDRSAKVTVDFLEPKKVRGSKIYKSGLPVVIVFKRESTNTLIVSTKQTLQDLWDNMPTQRRMRDRTMQGLQGWWTISQKASTIVYGKIVQMGKTGASLYHRWQTSALRQRAIESLRDWGKFSLATSRYVLSKAQPPASARLRAITGNRGGSIVKGAGTARTAVQFVP
jgi:hypothetical protein